MMSQWGDRGRK